jgi:hypothetical protein
MYSQKVSRQDITNDTPDYEGAQEEELPANCFCVQDEMNIVHGKKTKQARTMRMGVTMRMDVVDHGRELRKGTTIFLG